MDAKPLAPAEIAGLLRDESAGLFFPEGADRLDAQAAEITALRARVAGLEGALTDLLSWFPDNPSKPEWRIPAGEDGADEALEFARTISKSAQEARDAE